MFSKNEKKKKGPALAAGIGALAVYGAYSVVSKIKNMTTDKMSALMNKMKRKRGASESQSGCSCDTDMDDGNQY